MSFKKDLYLLLKPYYWVNIILSLSFIIAKRAPFVCSHLTFLFPDDSEFCELGGRETEILFFLIIVIMIRTRKTGSTTMITYLTSSFIYTKVANLILWFYHDFRLGVAYGIMIVLVGLMVPEPTYSGPEHVTYFRTVTGLDDEMERDKRVIWVVTFYTVWNPACVNFAPIFAELSAEYALENLKFGKVDIGRFPDVGKKYHVSDSSLSKQLPTIIMFKNGKEVERRPNADAKGKLQKFFFSSDNIKAAFDLNNIYKECKENPMKAKKQQQAVKDKKEN